MPTSETLENTADFRPQLLNSLADLLKSIHRVRGQEALDYLGSVYLPSLNCPPEVAASFTTTLRDADAKAFRKFFVDFVKSVRRGS